MIKEIRDHIKTQIKAAESKYKQADQPFFKDEEAVGTKVNYTYAVEFGAFSQISEENGEVFGSIEVILKTYRQGSKDRLADHDAGFCDAIIINTKILDRSSFINAEYIKDVTGVDVAPALVDESQNIYMYTNTLNFNIAYGIGD